MSEEMQLDGKTYISSKRASQLSGYAQDYIGQLARKALIDARRIGGLWYVSMDSLQAYQKKAEEFKPEPPSRKDLPANPETLVFFDGKEYISAAKAAEVTGYAQDYVGQLARSQSILSQQVGNRWYVEKKSILAHKAEKDRLLAAVQSESVGLKKQKILEKKNPQYLTNTGYIGESPVLNYFNEDDDLLPVTGKHNDVENLRQVPNAAGSETEVSAAVESRPVSLRSLPIRKVLEYRPQTREFTQVSPIQVNDLPVEAQKSRLPLLLGAAATIIIVLSVGYTSILKQNSVYAANIREIGPSSLSANVSSAVVDLGNILEPYLTRELNYVNPDTQ